MHRFLICLEPVHFFLESQTIEVAEEDGEKRGGRGHVRLDSVLQADSTGKHRSGSLCSLWFTRGKSRPHDLDGRDVSYVKISLDELQVGAPTAGELCASRRSARSYQSRGGCLGRNTVTAERIQDASDQYVTGPDAQCNRENNRQTKRKRNHQSRQVPLPSTRRSSQPQLAASKSLTATKAPAIKMQRTIQIQRKYQRLWRASLISGSSALAC